MSMPYSSILAIIDANLDRLQKARKLLTQQAEAFEQMPAPKRRGRAATRAVIATASVTQPAPEAQPQAAAPVVAEPMPLVAEAAIVPRVVKPMRKRRETSYPVKPSAFGLSALAGAVPATPVYVSADRVREIQAQKRTADQAAAVAQAALSEVPTAEMLSRRWLTNTAN